MRISVLYIDEYIHNLLVFNAHFRTLKNYEVHLCSTSREAFQVLLDFPMNVIIVDQPLPTMTGIEFLEDLPPMTINPIKFIVTGHRDFSLVEKAKEDGMIKDFYTKPYDLTKIEEAISKALRDSN